MFWVRKRTICPVLDVYCFTTASKYRSSGAFRSVTTTEFPAMYEKYGSTFRVTSLEVVKGTGIVVADGT